MNVLVFTDGASRGNPGPAGWGAVVAGSDRVVELGGGKEKGTNNEAEVAAVVAAVSFVQNKFSDVDSVKIHSDSTYAISGATSWIHGWKKRNWQTKQGEEISNKALWQHWDRLTKNISFDISFQKVKGHASIPGNERADDIATAFADDTEPELFDGPRADYEISLDPEPQYLEKSPLYFSLIDNKAMQHENWNDCQARVKGESAKYKKVRTVAERDELLAEWGVELADVMTE